MLLDERHSILRTHFIFNLTQSFTDNRSPSSVRLTCKTCLPDVLARTRCHLRIYCFLVERGAIMTALDIRLLGPPVVTWGEDPVHITRRQTRALLYRLAVNLEPMPREHLCFLFWANAPEMEARRNLSHLLTHLRASLPEADLICTDDDHVEMDRTRVYADTVQFVTGCEAYQRAPQMELLYEVQDLYRGPMLAGFSLPGSSEFEAWLTVEQRGMERMYLEVLAVLVEEHIRRGAFGDAIQYAEEYLLTNGFDEEMHCRLIELYGVIGDRGAALRQYQRCADTLRRELGLRPSTLTQNAYGRVLGGVLSASTLQATVDARLSRLCRHKQLHHHYVRLYPRPLRHRA